MNETTSTPNLLIVDDTPDHIRIAQNILHSQGYRIRAATNGLAALKLINRELPTLILLDVKMEGLDGFELCKTLKAKPEYQDIAIIFMTALDDADSIETGFALGAQDYVVKPYHASELIARVNAHMKIALQRQEMQYAYNELDQFCHTVSHDLKSPLQVIEQLAGLLKEELSNPSPDTKETCQEILEHLTGKCRQTLLMNQRLLELSRLSQLSCHFTSVDMTALFENTLIELTSLYPERQIRYHVDTLPLIQGDAVLLTHLCQNIISNAIKFTKTRAIARIQVSSGKTHHGDLITIQDNGVGFDMEYSDHLFRIFERLHSASEYEGSGVGLTIALNIMKRHNGSIALTGIPDTGATVSLIFPFRI